MFKPQHNSFYSIHASSPPENGQDQMFHILILFILPSKPYSYQLFPHIQLLTTLIIPSRVREQTELHEKLNGECCITVWLAHKQSKYHYFHYQIGWVHKIRTASASREYLSLSQTSLTCIYFYFISYECTLLSICIFYVHPYNTAVIHILHSFLTVRILANLGFFNELVYINKL